MWDFQGEALLSTGWVKDCWASGVRQQLVNSDQSDPEQKAGGLGKKAVYKTSHPRALLKKKKKKSKRLGYLVKPPYRLLDIFGFILCS